MLHLALEVYLLHMNVMGKAEAPASAETPQVADGAVAVEIPKDTSAKGGIPTKPPKRLPKPNKEEMEAKVSVLHEMVTLVTRARIDYINSIVLGKSRQSEYPKLIQLKENY